MNEMNKIQSIYENIIFPPINSADEVDLMTDGESNVREYKESDYVSLKNGGEGRIVKILYVVMDNEDEVLFLKKCDLGNHTQKDI